MCMWYGLNSIDSLNSINSMSYQRFDWEICMYWMGEYKWNQYSKMYLETRDSQSIYIKSETL